MAKDSLAVPIPNAEVRQDRRGMTPSRREAAWGFVFVAPWIIGFLLFTIGPLVASLVLSFTDFNLVRPEATRFVGLDNYARMAADPLVLQGLVVTAKFAAVAIPVTTIASLVRLVGIEGPDWTNNATWVYPALTLIGLWGIGNMMLVYLAGLQSVPSELYEAARIDGAGPWSMFRRITIPLMSPILLYNLVISLITTFQYFTQAYVLTNGRGDPNNATLFINLDLFREAFVNNHMGYASAIGWLLFVIVLGLTLALFLVARKRVYYAGGET
jgi:multiple sugar transport system permease protein